MVNHPLRTLPILLAALPLAATAQNASPSSRIVITAPKAAVPLNATSTSAASLNALRAATGDTASLLRATPGISLYGAGGASSLPAIHGLADERLRIKVDGMDLIAACPNHMNPPLSYLDPTMVGTLKVFAGITPVSVGGDSIGGTIVADTAAPAFAAPGQAALVKGRLGAYFRSNNDARGASLAASYATETFNLSYNGALSRAGNYKAGGDFKTWTETGRGGHMLPLDEVGSSAYETRTHLLGLALRNAKHLVEAKLGVQDVPYQYYPNQRMDMLGNTQQRVNLRYLGQFDWGTLEARAYREGVEHEMDFGPDRRYWYGTLSGAGVPCAPLGGAPNSCAAGMPMLTDSTNSGATLKASLALSEQETLRLGSEIQRYRLDDWWPPSGGGMWPGTFWNIFDGRRDRTAMFAEWEAQASKTWSTLLGARYERVRSNAGEVRGYGTAAGAPGSQVADAARFNALDRERSDHNWDLTALLRHTPHASLDIEVGVARKVRSPSLYERYAWSTWPMAATMNNFVGDGNGYVGNPDLRPETAHTLSATFDWHASDRRWALRATPYYTQVADFIDAVRCTTALLPGSACPATSTVTDQFVVLQYANQSARLYGIDLSGHMPLAEGGWGRWGLEGLVNVTDGQNRRTGDALYNIMPLNARLTLTHKVGGWDSGMELVLVKAKDRVSDVRNEIRTAGYGLVNLRASRAWKHLRVDFGIENLLDRRHELPLGGAYVGQGRTMSMNGVPWGTAVPGMGRSLHAAVTYEF
ncbi:MAG: TonB-dependent receptor [Rubrivivax sp.]|nr:TonB-dependent receptor [Rubrivivax sp.]